MRQIRNCDVANLNTGSSKCPIDFGKIKGAIVMPKGVNLPAKLTADVLKELCHADRPARIYPIVGFVEYSKDGGEVQVSAQGYGGQKASGVSARTDKYTLDKFNESLNASLLKTMNTEYDVYYFDEDNIIYGQNDGTDVLAGIPMRTIYPNATPHPTSSATATMDVCFALNDVQDSEEKFDYIQADFEVADALLGLVEVQVVNVSGTKFKIVEKIGGFDRTAEFGEIIAENPTTVMSNVTVATYNEEDETLTITAGDGGTPALKKPSVLYANEIEGIEGV